MNKSELIDSIAAKAELTKADAGKALDALISTIQDVTAQPDGSVALVGFGTFTTKTREARKGRNPQTGAELDIPKSRLPVFKPGKAFKDATNK